MSFPLHSATLVQLRKNNYKKVIMKSLRSTVNSVSTAKCCNISNSCQVKIATKSNAIKISSNCNGSSEKIYFKWKGCLINLSNSGIFINTLQHKVDSRAQPHRRLNAAFCTEDGCGDRTLLSAGRAIFHLHFPVCSDTQTHTFLLLSPHKPFQRNKRAFHKLKA